MVARGQVEVAGRPEQEVVTARAPARRRDPHRRIRGPARRPAPAGAAGRAPAGEPRRDREHRSVRLLGAGQCPERVLHRLVELARQPQRDRELDVVPDNACLVAETRRDGERLLTVLTRVLVLAALDEPDAQRRVRVAGLGFEARVLRLRERLQRIYDDSKKG